MARMVKVVGTSLLGLVLTGCVTQEKYNALKLDRDGLAEQLARAQTDASSARVEADTAKSNLNAIMNGQGNRDALFANLDAQLRQLQADNAELNRKYAEAMARPTGGVALPAALSNELQTFANQNPDLVDFDAARGMVKFKSDVTFASGDAALTPKAKEVIARFATILNSPSAAGYELMVKGHTDNARVQNPETIAKGHKDNWYLSSHRSISVGTELLASNVNPQRVSVVGNAEYHPIAPNSSESGRAQNRRVEVLILPTTVRGSGVAGAPAAVPAKKINKDSVQNVQSDPQPVLNK